MEPDMYENAMGDEVEWDDLTDTERHYYSTRAWDPSGICISEYVDNVNSWASVCQDLDISTDEEFEEWMGSYDGEG